MLALSLFHGNVEKCGFNFRDSLFVPMRDMRDRYYRYCRWHGRTRRRERDEEPGGLLKNLAPPGLAGPPSTASQPLRFPSFTASSRSACCEAEEEDDDDDEEEEEEEEEEE